MIDLTLTFPTRKRPGMLREFFQNVRGTVENPESVEIIVQYDIDDPESAGVLEEVRQLYPTLRVIPIRREHGDNLSEDYYNWLVRNKVYHGKYMMVGGDDVRFLTPGWDRTIPEWIEGYLLDKPDRICCVYPLDRSTNKPKLEFEWGWFPILTREAMDTLGWFFPKEARTWGADVLIATIFHAVGRLEGVRDTMVDHISYHVYTMPKDEVSHKMSEVFNKTKQEIGQYRNHGMIIDIERLRDGIRGVVKGKPV